MLNSKEKERLLYPDKDKNRKLTHFQARKKLENWYKGIEDVMLVLVTLPKKKKIGTIVTDEVVIRLLNLAATHMETYPLQTLRNRPAPHEKASDDEIRKQKAFFDAVKRLITALPFDSTLDHEILEAVKNKGRY